MVIFTPKYFYDIFFWHDRNIVALATCFERLNDIDHFGNINRYGAIAHINVSGSQIGSSSKTSYRKKITT